MSERGSLQCVKTSEGRKCALCERLQEESTIKRGGSFSPQSFFRAKRRSSPPFPWTDKSSPHSASTTSKLPSTTKLRQQSLDLCSSYTKLSRSKRASSVGDTNQDPANQRAFQQRPTPAPTTHSSEKSKTPKQRLPPLQALQIALRYPSEDDTAGTSVQEPSFPPSSQATATWSPTQQRQPQALS